MTSYVEGSVEGYDEGYDEGYAEGYADGYAENKKEIDELKERLIGLKVLPSIFPVIGQEMVISVRDVILVSVRVNGCV